MNATNQQQQRPFEVNLRIAGKFQKVTVMASTLTEAVERATSVLFSPKAA